MKIGIDIDGTIVKPISKIYGKIGNNNSMILTSDIKSSEIDDYEFVIINNALHYESVPFTTKILNSLSKGKLVNELVLMPDSKKYINKLAKNHEIIILSNRNKKLHELTKKYLINHDISFNKLICDEKLNKVKEDIDILIDDNINFASEFANINKYAILFINDYNHYIEHFGLNINLGKGILKISNNWEQIYDYIRGL